MPGRGYGSHASGTLQAARRRNGDRHQDTRLAVTIGLRHHRPAITRVYLGIGSNIDAEVHMPAAAKKLRAAFPEIAFSPVYRSTAVDDTDQSDFLNAAAVLETSLSPKQVQKKLQAIERLLGKKKTRPYGPRTIDLDILLYGNEVLLGDDLTVPHLRLHARRFVLLPLEDLGAIDLIHPAFERPLSAYLRDAEPKRCVKTGLVL